MELWHELAGSGPPVVLLHAGICDSRMWEPQWEPFTARHRVLRLDLRGFGNTPMPPEPYSHARDVVALLDRLALGPAAVIGCSMAGVVDLELAIARPDLVDRLVLVCSGLPGGERSQEMREFGVVEEAAWERGDVEAVVEESVRFWVDGPRRERGAAPAPVRELVKTMYRRAVEVQLPVEETASAQRLVPDLRDRIGEIAVPTLVVVGEEDASDMLAVAEQLAATIPGARLERIAGAAHLPSLERPEAFNALVQPFLG